MQSHPNDEASIVHVLDDFYDAAARADEPRYFDHFADNGVFLGTDATERWDVTAFRAYAHPHFAKGKAWDMHAVRRHVTISPAANVAYFDEELETKKLGPARGSGVLERPRAPQPLSKSRERGKCRRCDTSGASMRAGGPRFRGERVCGCGAEFAWVEL
jgi:hypothetical protein